MSVQFLHQQRSKTSSIILFIFVLIVFALFILSSSSSSSSSTSQQQIIKSDNKNPIVITTLSEKPPSSSSPMTTVLNKQIDFKNYQSTKCSPFHHEKNISAVGNKKKKYLVMDVAPPSSTMMGLTNVMIWYSEAIFLALLSERNVLVLPQSSADSSFIDFKTTAKCFGLEEIISFKEFQKRQTKSTKLRKLQLPGRFSVLNTLDKARNQLMSSIHKTSGASAVRVGTVLWHVPFLPNDPLSWRQPAQIFNAMEFSQEVKQRAAKFLEKYFSSSSENDNNNNNNNKQQQRIRSIAFHMRFEPDIVGFSSQFSPPSDSKLRTFLKSCLIPRILRRLMKSSGGDSSSDDVVVVKVVLLGGSSMDPKLLKTVVEEFEQIKQQEQKFLIYSTKNGGELLSSSSSVSSLNQKQQQQQIDQNESASSSAPTRTTTTTNHKDAGVDALIGIAVGEMLIGADYSTFTRGIQIRKCLLDNDRFESMMLYDQKLSRIREVKGKKSICYQQHYGENVDEKSTKGGEVFAPDDGAGGVFGNPYATMPHAYVPVSIPFLRDVDKC